MAVPLGVLSTSGWNWTPYSRRARSSSAALGQLSVDAAQEKPSGRRTMRSVWLIRPICSASSPANSGEEVSTRMGVRPYSLVEQGATSPPIVHASSWEP